MRWGETTIALLLGSAALVCVSCGRHPTPVIPVPVENKENAAFQAQGMAAIQDAFSTLSSNLLAALEEGGTSHAIPYCSIEAPSLTADASRRHGLHVRRISDRVRNPQNIASPEEAIMMAQMRHVLELGRTPAPHVVHEGDGRVLYAPIVLTQPLCLMCHGAPGAQVEPETLARIRELYPNDQATGFALNDLRGMWVVRERPAETAP